MNLHEQIAGRLGRDFVKADQVARILSLALASNKNVLLWGPGGHGKSEMVEVALGCVAERSEIFVQSFGEGLDEAALWGGLDFRRLEEEKVLEYHPERSFLSKPYAVFEEMFDAPAVVLLALKDTLTAKELRKGSQRFSMVTKVVVAVTNRDPSEVAELGPAAQALLERFPLQLKVEWPSYTAADYKELLGKVKPRIEKAGTPLNGAMPVLADLLGKAAAEGNIVSPRSAVHAAQVAQAAARMRGAHECTELDLGDLIFVPGMESWGQMLTEELEAAKARAEALEKMERVEARVTALETELASAETPIKALQAVKRLREAEASAGELRVPDALLSRRDKLRNLIGQKILEGQTKALETTRI